MHKLCTAFDKDVRIGDICLLYRYEGHYCIICFPIKKYFLKNGIISVKVI